MRKIIEPARETPVIEETDVVVVGGGTAGVIAALAARRMHAKTLLVERYGYLGGMVTGSYVTALLGFEDGVKPVIKGIPQELVKRLSDMGGCTPVGKLGYVDADVEIYKWVAISMLQEAGVQLLLHSWAVDTVTEGNDLKGIIIESKSGRQAVMGKVVVDTTGDGDIAKFAGAPYSTGRHSWGMELVTIIEGIDKEKVERFKKENPERFKMLTEEPKVKEGTPDRKVAPGFEFTKLDALNSKDLTKVEMESRNKTMLRLNLFKKNIPGYESARVKITSPQMGVRESRRIMGEYTLTKEDVEKERKFADTVLRVPMLKERSFDVPYRCLIPQKVDNLLVAGRCISVEHEALDYIRTIAPCMGLGQAAGTAAALAVRQNVRPRDLDISLLKKALIEQGANLG